MHRSKIVVAISKLNKDDTMINQLSAEIKIDVNKLPKKRQITRQLKGASKCS